MKFLLLNPNWNEHNTPLSTDTAKPPICTPLEFAYIANVLLPHHEVDFLDAYSNDYDRKEVAQIASDYAPDHIVLGDTPSCLYWRCPPLDLSVPKKLIRSLRKKVNASITLIGPHATISPAETMEELECDIVFSGDPSQCMRRFISDSSPDGLKIVEYNDRFTESDFSRIDYRIFHNLSNYTPHAWFPDKTFVEKYSPAVLAEASRGCPYRCGYCFKKPLRDRYVQKPIEQLHDEIEQIARLGVKYVFFIDEIFCVEDSHLHELLGLLKQNGIAFGCQVKIQKLDKSLIQRLAASGCVYIEIGVDIVDDNCNKIIGRELLSASFLSTINICRRYIEVVRYNRLNPLTYDYMCALGLSSSHIRDWEYPADPIIPYPNTRFGEAALRRHGLHTYSWKFAEVYYSWLRIEVFIQRRIGRVRAMQIACVLMRVYLRLPNLIRSVLNRFLSVFLIDDFWNTQNKYTWE